MMFGSPCHRCGRSDCRWNLGGTCEGSAPRLADGVRMSIEKISFGPQSHVYFLEERSYWLFPIIPRWSEIPATRGMSPDLAVATAVLNHPDRDFLAAPEPVS